MDIETKEKEKLVKIRVIASPVRYRLGRGQEKNPFNHDNLWLKKNKTPEYKFKGLLVVMLFIGKD